MTSLIHRKMTSRSFRLSSSISPRMYQHTAKSLRMRSLNQAAAFPHFYLHHLRSLSCCRGRCSLFEGLSTTERKGSLAIRYRSERLSGTSSREFVSLRRPAWKVDPRRADSPGPDLHRLTLSDATLSHITDGRIFGWLVVNLCVINTS